MAITDFTKIIIDNIKRALTHYTNVSIVDINDIKKII